MILLHYIKYNFYFLSGLSNIMFFKSYCIPYIYIYIYIKDACLITIRNKTTVWKLANSSPIESEHLYMRNLKIPHKTKQLKSLLINP
jgi:amino acid transporter